MANITTGNKRLLLRWLYSKAEKSGQTLLSQIEFAAFSRIEETESGTVIIGTNGSGHAVTATLPSGGYKASEIPDAFEDLLQLHEDSVSALIARGVTDPTDIQIREEMLGELKPITEVYSDQTLLRCGR